MKTTSCPQEAIVSHSARTGCWGDSTREHIRECLHCRELARAVEYLGNIAGPGDNERPLPAAAEVWRSARRRALREARDRALRPLAIAESVANAITVLALAAGLVWIWFRFQSLAAHALPPGLRMPQAIILAGTALATCLIALLFTRMVQPSLIEE